MNILEKAKNNKDKKKKDKLPFAVFICPKSNARELEDYKQIFTDIISDRITEKDFESIKHVDENGTEFWYARELMTMLEYSKWGNFIKVIDKAKESCKNSNMNVLDHFADVGKMIMVAKGEKEKLMIIN